MDDTYDVGIVGAGIAGSCLAIQLANHGLSVVIFEKDSYPKHKVCGEFLSRESEPFLTGLGVQLSGSKYPRINQLRLTGQSGYEVLSDLKVGGIGISRYDLDYQLMDIMKNVGVVVKEATRVKEVNQDFIHADKQYRCNWTVSAHGKYRPVQKSDIEETNSKNFVGIKYHINTDADESEIALHSFPGGYCGMSKVENNRYCLCYLVDSKILKKHKSSIESLEEFELGKNPHLRQIFKNSEKIFSTPLAVSNVRFDKKGVVLDGVLQLGDAAGCISPLAGNGMSMAARSSKFLAGLLIDSKPDRERIVKEYNHLYDADMGERVKFAGILNAIMLNRIPHEITLRLIKNIPRLKRSVVQSMQGDYF